MAGLVHSIEELVGRTPLMELDRFERQQHHTNCRPAIPH